MITGDAVLAGVVGWPVAHSRSPRLHNHWLAKAGIDGAFVPLAVAPASFEVARDAWTQPAYLSLVSAQVQEGGGVWLRYRKPAQEV